MHLVTAESFGDGVFPPLTVQNLRHLFHLIPAAIAVLDTEMRYIMVSQRWLEVYELTATPILGKTHVDLFPALSEQWPAIQQRCLAEGRDRGADVCFTRANGKTEWLQWEVVPWIDETGGVQGILLWTEVITHQKQLELALEIAQTQLAHAIAPPGTIQAELAQRQRQYESLVQAVPVGIFRTTPNGKCLYVNQRWCEMAGCSMADAVGDGWVQAIHPPDRDRVAKQWQQAIAANEDFRIECRMQHRDGDVFWVYAQVVAERDAPGQVVGYVGSVTDVSDRQVVEAALSESEAKFRQLVENANDLIWSCTLDGILTYVSPNAWDWLGYEVEALLGQSFALLVHPDDLAAVNAFLHHIAQTGEKKSSIEFRECHKDGSYFWVTAKASAMTNAAGVVIGVQGILRDVSDRKQMEYAFQQNQQLLELVMDALPQNTFWKDRNSVYLGCNKRYAQLCGLPHPDAIVGKTDYDLPFALNDVEWYRELDRRVMSQNQPVYGVVEPLRSHPAAPPAWTEINKIPLHDAAGNVIGILGTFQDVTERVEAQQAVQQSEADLRRKTQELEHTLAELRRTQMQMVQAEKMSSLGQLVAGVAHEINNPVNFIVGNLSHAKDYTDDLLQLIRLYEQQFPEPGAAIAAAMEAIELDFIVEDLPRLLASMNVGADRIQAIVASLRTFSRMDEAEMKSVDIHEGIDSTLVILHNRIKAKSDRVAIHVQKNYGAFPWVECYAGQLNQVFMNILSNAIDALEDDLKDRALRSLETAPKPAYSVTQSAPPTITITTQLVETTHIQICFADNGPGMSPHVRDRIFDPFFTTKPIGRGTGMGLSISYQIIVEKHGGTLDCITTPGQGTEFVISIPIRQSQESQLR